MEDNTAPVARPQYPVPGRWTRFLWWLSTAEPELLETCLVDRNRYAIVGMTVLGTWSFATLAWTYFFSTVVGNLWMAVLLGIFMGGMILTIDRALIKGIGGRANRKWLPFVFRTALALVIGLFMAQPALLYLFNKEIHVQISLDNEQRRKEKRQKQDSVYFAEQQQLLRQKETIRQEMDRSYGEVAAARRDFIAETDGTGGSRKIGLKDIAQAKQKNYEQLDAGYRQRETQWLPQLQQIDSTLLALAQTKQREQALFETLLNDGFITRIEALNHLIRQNSSVAFRYYLLVAILLLIELMPVLSKAMLPEGSYEEKAKLRETLERELIRNNHKRELALKELYNETAFGQDAALVKEFFEKTNHEKSDKLHKQVEQWKEDRSLDEVWQEVKKDMLSKPES